jgi:hypothetical protein
MVELYDKQTPAEGAFQYAWPFFSETLRPSSFIYNAFHPLLVPGRRYAWRVRVVARDGMQQEMTVFKNNGYSEVFYFDYAADCQPVQMLGAIIEKRRVNITWMETGALEYTVEYRKKGSSRWYTAGDVKPGQAYLFNLQFGREYEYRVGCRCVQNDVFAYSAVKSFRMPDREDKSPQCGIMPESRITNRTPADALVKGQAFMAGDFLVFVTRASGSGVFSGEGYVGIPYLNNAQVAVTFSNIVVNTDGQLVSGFVETKFDLVTNNIILDVDEKLTGGSGVGDIRTGEEKAAFEVDYVINSDIKVKPLTTDDSEDGITGSGGSNTFTRGENGKYQIVFTDDKNGEHILETDSFPFTIKDKNGNEYDVILTESASVSIFTVNERGQDNSLNQPVDTMKAIVKVDELVTELQKRIREKLSNSVDGYVHIKYFRTNRVTIVEPTEEKIKRKCK